MIRGAGAAAAAVCALVACGNSSGGRSSSGGSASASAPEAAAVAIVRKHSAGQRYQVHLETQRLGTTHRSDATVTVTEAGEERAKFAISIDAASGGTAIVAGTKLTASATFGGPLPLIEIAGPESTLEDTVRNLEVEKMLGGNIPACVPPEDAHAIGETWAPRPGVTATFVGIDRDGGRELAHFRVTDTAPGIKGVSDYRVALDDGYSGSCSVKQPDDDVGSDHFAKSSELAIKRL